MRPRTLIGLMFCALFSLSAPAFAQTAQPVIQTAQAAQSDVTIPEGTVREFDAAKGEIKFDGTLTNKGTIIIKSSNPAQTEAILSAAKFVNEGKIVSEVPSLTINASILGGTGDYNAPEAINVHGTDRLEIRGGRFYSEWFRPKTKGWLIINANRIDGKVELEADELSMGVREGNLNVVKQKLDGDPLIYNTGGDITTPIAPSGGHDILVVASGNVTLGSGIDATGSATNTEGKIAIGTGVHFVNQTNGEVILPCGISNGMGNDCNNLYQSLSLPGGPLEAQQGDFPLSGKITITGEVKAKVIIMTSKEIEINGNLRAVKDGDPAQATVSLFASKSIVVTGTIKTDANTADPNYGNVNLSAPSITVSSKITSDSVTLNASETVEATTGSITTGAVEARFISMNGGAIVFQEVGGALLPSALPHDSGEFTIKTGKLTARSFITLAATGNIDAGNIELLPDEAEVPLAEHWVRIHANVGKEDAAPLKIGGGTNGAASITVHGTTDMGPGLTQKTGAIFLTNGPSGDIVLDGAKILITNEHDGTPSLIASAGTGQITVKGNITFDGTSTAPAGQILLVGDEIRSTGATISAKDTLAAAAEKPAKVILVTSKLTLAGNLTIEANSKAQTSVRVVPKGSVVIDPQEHAVTVSVDKFNINATEEEVLVAGGGNLTIKAKSDEAKVEITAKPLKFNNGTSEIFATGTGSTINVDYPGSPTGQNTLNFNGGGVTFDTSNPNSDAGDINILADKVRNAALANVSLKANADTTGKGGNITISMDRGTLALGSEAGAMSLIATSNGGDGGVVTINNDVHNGRITYQTTGTGPAIDVSSLGGNGDGGRIELKTDTLTDDGIVAVAAVGGLINTDTFIAAADGSGEGGTFVVTGKDFNFAGRVNLPAGPGGKGGSIEIVATRSIILGDELQFAEFFADGINGGSGGSVNIVTPTGVAVDLSRTKISATGSDTGEGGKVFITEAKGFIDPEHTDSGINVPFVIRVDGGGNRAPGQSSGSISLNGVTCGQWKTNAATYPKVAWDCITPESGANISTLVTAGASLSPTLQLTLAVLVTTTEPANPMVGVYAMKDLADFQKFFGRSQEPPSAKQYARSHISWLRVSGTFESNQGVPNTTISGSPTIMVGALVHELGHHLDYIWGPGLTTLSSQTAWSSLIAPEFAEMDLKPCNAVFFQATCDAHSQTNSNSAIFKIQFGELYANGQPDPGEFFAAMFEHMESVLTGNPPSYQVEPELEKALDSMVQLKAHMSNLIANPPQPVK